MKKLSDKFFFLIFERASEQIRKRLLPGSGETYFSAVHTYHLFLYKHSIQETYILYE